MQVSFTPHPRHPHPGAGIADDTDATRNADASWGASGHPSHPHPGHPDSGAGTPDNSVDTGNAIATRWTAENPSYSRSNDSYTRAWAPDHPNNPGHACFAGVPLRRLRKLCRRV
jgi:hypothetical protein